MRMKKDRLGRIVSNEENFFLKYLWGANFWRFLVQGIWNLLAIKYPGDDAKKPSYPKNTCSLLWGTFPGAPLCWALTLFCSPFCLSLGLVIWCIIIIAFLFGFVGDFRADKYRGFYEKDKTFHPYMKYGRWNEKRLPIAPWYIWAPALLIWLLIIKDFMVSKYIAGVFVLLSRQIVWVATNLVAFIVLGGIAIIVLAVFFFRSTVWQVCRETIKSIKDNTCIPIVYEKTKRDKRGNV